MKKSLGLVFLVLMLVLAVGCMAVQTTDEDNELTYKLTDTGQNKSYDSNGNEIDPAKGEAFYGQDAQYEGIEASFTDNGDGTITDNVTGLMWQQVPDSINMSWEEAKEYCENLELGGYDDWRLPTVKELFAIGSFETGWPFLDTDYFEFPEAFQMEPVNVESQDGRPQPGPQDGAPQTGPQNGAPQTGPQGGGPQGGPLDESTTNNQAEMAPPPSSDNEDGSIGKDQGQFWTSNFYYVGTTHGGAATAFGVNHATGHIKGYPSDVSGPMGKFVRAVRGDITAENNFVDNGDGTISDLNTGLMWMADDNGEGV